MNRVGRPTSPQMLHALALYDGGMLRADAARAAHVTEEGLRRAIYVREQHELYERGPARKAVKAAGLALTRNHVDRALDLLSFYPHDQVVQYLRDEAHFMTGARRHA